jgi:hypothetical protein
LRDFNGNWLLVVGHLIGYSAIRDVTMRLGPVAMNAAGDPITK